MASATFRIWRGDASGGAFEDHASDVSEGMVVASGPGGEEIFVLSPDEGAKPGQRVH